MAFVNKRVAGEETFYPLNEPAIGHSLDAKLFPQNHKLPALFQPLTLRGVTFPNRIFVSPMCQYSSDNGHATDWHFVHIGGFATRGFGGIIMEATSVVPEGRISPQDAGLWQDSQIEPLQRIVRFAHTQGAKVGIQLAHAGRKSSTMAPWVHSDPAHSRVAPTYVSPDEDGGWADNVYAPSAIPFSDTYPKPKEMSAADIQTVEDAFIASVARSQEAGFDFIELHLAHGYLGHEFLSPLSNTRTDEFGGQSLENRMRWPLRLVERVREAWKGPLFVRISATDWASTPEKGEDGQWLQWGIEQSKIFAAELEKRNVDFIDCSTGGLWVQQKIKVEMGYQVPYAHALKDVVKIPVGTVGLITEPRQAESYLQEGKADVVLLAREAIRDPHWPIRAANEFKVAIKPANQYERGWAPVLTPAKPECLVEDRAKEQGSH